MSSFGDPKRLLRLAAFTSSARSSSWATQAKVLGFTGAFVRPAEASGRFCQARRTVGLLFGRALSCGRPGCSLPQLAPVLCSTTRHLAGVCGETVASDERLSREDAEHAMALRRVMLCGSLFAVAVANAGGGSSCAHSSPAEEPGASSADNVALSVSHCKRLHDEAFKEVHELGLLTGEVSLQAPEVKIKRKRAHERREDDLETNTLLIQMGAKLTPDMSLEDGAAHLWEWCICDGALEGSVTDALKGKGDCAIADAVVDSHEQEAEAGLWDRSPFVSTCFGEEAAHLFAGLLEGPVTGLAVSRGERVAQELRDTDNLLFDARMFACAASFYKHDVPRAVQDPQTCALFADALYASLDAEALKRVEEEAAVLLYRRGFLKSPTAVLRFASPSLFKPLNGALEFTPDQLAGVGKHITDVGFHVHLEDDHIYALEPASGNEVYPTTDRASWPHPEHKQRYCPFDMYQWKLATFGPMWWQLWIFKEECREGWLAGAAGAQIMCLPGGQVVTNMPHQLQGAGTSCGEQVCCKQMGYRTDDDRLRARCRHIFKPANGTPALLMAEDPTQVVGKVYPCHRRLGNNIYPGDAHGPCRAYRRGGLPGSPPPLNEQREIEKIKQDRAALNAALGVNAYSMAWPLQKRAKAALVEGRRVAAALVPAVDAVGAAAAAVRAAVSKAEAEQAEAAAAEAERNLAPLRQREATAEQVLEEVRVAFCSVKAERKRRTAALDAALGVNAYHLSAPLRQRATKALGEAKAVAAALVPAVEAAEAAAVAVELADSAAETEQAGAAVAEAERKLAPLRQREAAAEQVLEEVRVAFSSAQTEARTPSWAAVSTQAREMAGLSKEEVWAAKSTRARQGVINVSKLSRDFTREQDAAVLDTILSAMDKVGKMPRGKWQAVMVLLSAPPISIFYTQDKVRNRFHTLMSAT